MCVSLSVLAAVFLSIWVAYVLMPELDSAAKEREWSRPERERAKQRKKEKKLGIQKDIEAWRLVVADEAPISPGWSPGNRSGMQPGHCRIPITDRDGCGAGQ